ncbi:unnamed protein product, partial [Pylaiella littoralis]
MVDCIVTSAGGIGARFFVFPFSLFCACVCGRAFCSPNVVRARLGPENTSRIKKKHFAAYEVHITSKYIIPPLFFVARILLFRDRGARPSKISPFAVCCYTQ